MTRQGPCPFCGSHRLGSKDYQRFCGEWRRFYIDRQIEWNHSVHGQASRVLTNVAFAGANRKVMI